MVMKKLLLLSSLFLSLNVSAQRIDKPNEPYDIYCTVSITLEASIIMGEDKEEYYILNENGEKMKFNKETQIMTYMSKKGWDYVERTGDYKLDFLFRKKIKSDEEAFSDFKLVHKFGKNKGKPRELTE